MYDHAKPIKAIGAVLIGLIAIGAVTGTTSQTNAQQTTMIGGHGGQSVAVDLSVLDNLPSLSTLPELLRSGLRPHPARAVERLPLRGERVMSGQLSLTPGQSVPAPKPAIKPLRPKIVSPKAWLPPSSLSRATALKAGPPPAKPRIAAPAATMPPPVKPRGMVAAHSAPPPSPKLATLPVPRASFTASTQVPKARVLAPVIAPGRPPPPKPLNSNKTPAIATGNEAAPTAEGDRARLVFDQAQTVLAKPMAASLTGLIKSLKADKARRVQLLAYAAAPGGEASNGSKARRLSLSRALSVRAYLMGQGVRSTRMDVRAMGDRAKSGPANRVDVVIVTR
jgi:outer membrane protein OmpA-like peptidoglycan-associated protein